MSTPGKLQQRFKQTGHSVAAGMLRVAALAALAALAAGLADVPTGKLSPYFRAGEGSVFISILPSLFHSAGLKLPLHCCGVPC